MLAIAFMLLGGAILPSVENPWPDSIGLDFPFTVAGAFGVIADVINTNARPAERDRSIKRAGVHGFRWGAGAYLLSLAVQIGSGL